MTYDPSTFNIATATVDELGQYLRSNGEFKLPPPRPRWRSVQEPKQKRIDRVRQMRQRVREIKARSVEYLGGKCVKCGLVDDPCVYDFHHRDPREKDGVVSKLIQSGWTKDLVSELEKCDLLCAHCHRKVERDLTDSGYSAKSIRFQLVAQEAA